jgi:hypothetical protein
MSSCPCFHVPGIPHPGIGTNGKRQLPFVFCKWKTEMANFRLLLQILEIENGHLFSLVGKR